MAKATREAHRDPPRPRLADEPQREQDGMLRWYGRARRKGVRDLVWAAWSTRDEPGTSSPTA